MEPFRAGSAISCVGILCRLEHPFVPAHGAEATSIYRVSRSGNAAQFRLILGCPSTVVTKASKPRSNDGNPWQVSGDRPPWARNARTAGLTSAGSAQDQPEPAANSRHCVRPGCEGQRGNLAVISGRSAGQRGLVAVAAATARDSCCCRPGRATTAREPCCCSLTGNEVPMGLVWSVR
jgi:hypothetical protein